MKKNRIVKFLALTLALVMLLSVTASAVSWTCNGASCSGSCGPTSATTTAGSPMYVKARVVSYYYLGGRYLNTASEADNAGTSITTYVSLPSGSIFDNSVGVHWSGNCGPYYSSYS